MRTSPPLALLVFPSFTPRVASANIRQRIDDPGGRSTALRGAMRTSSSPSRPCARTSRLRSVHSSSYTPEVERSSAHGLDCTSLAATAPVTSPSPSVRAAANGAECATGDYCDQDGTCHKLAGVGEACDENFACDNLDCSVNDGSQGTCQAVPDDLWVCYYDPS